MLQSGGDLPGEFLVRRPACFAVAMAVAAILAGPAWARIGVTSVTAGTTSVAQGTDLQIGQHHHRCGRPMRVTAGGLTQTATRSGSQINVAASGQPTLPTVLAPGQMTNIRSIDRAPSANRISASPTDTALAKSALHEHNCGLALQPVIAANTPATVPLNSTQQVQVVQTSQRFAMEAAVAAQLAAMAVAVPVPAALPIQTPPVALPTPVTLTPPPPTPPKTGGGTLTLSGATTIYTGGTTINGGSLKIVGVK
jgi:autotransporter-associated beta strand protein